MKTDVGDEHDPQHCDSSSPGKGQKQEANGPAAHGVVEPNQRPFFRSIVAQNTNNALAEP
jgi:hypothetical protein